MQVKREIIVTADGSKTIHMPDWNENYHSSHGALQEAKHVFLKYGLDCFKDHQEISIFEVGFGTGLNAILTCEATEINQQKIHYDGLEAYPVSAEEIEALDYVSLFENNESKANYLKIHAVNWDSNEVISPNFTLRKILQKLEEFTFEAEQYDLIYFDAFGPRTQDDMWQLAHFEKLFHTLKPNGILVTYCAKGQVKRDLKAAGFTIEALPGPPGKREMTRAWKKA
jgi:tRNA U34 5-methylaminomethyl-2-thiouridine-forming methyltransferase MnmC